MRDLKPLLRLRRLNNMKLTVLTISLMLIFTIVSGGLGMGFKYDGYDYLFIPEGSAEPWDKLPYLCGNFTKGKSIATFEFGWYFNQTYLSLEFLPVCLEFNKFSLHPAVGYEYYSIVKSREDESGWFPYYNPDPICLRKNSEFSLYLEYNDLAGIGITNVVNYANNHEIEFPYHDEQSTVDYFAYVLRRQYFVLSAYFNIHIARSEIMPLFTYSPKLKNYSIEARLYF